MTAKAQFVAALLPAALEASQRTGVDPRIIIAQAALESAWGKSAPGNNLFGIKSHGKSGGQTLATTEVVNGQPVRTNASFRQYADPSESVAGYADFILENPRYRPMMQAQGLDAQIAALGESGYATDPAYAEKIASIAKSIPLDGQPAMPTPQGVRQEPRPADAPRQAPPPQEAPRRRTAQLGFPAKSEPERDELQEALMAFFLARRKEREQKRAASNLGFSRNV